MNKYLDNFIARKNDELKALDKRSKESEDIAEIRSIGAQMDAIRADIEEARSQLAAGTGFDVKASFELGKAEARAEDPFGTVEYRQAFMKYAQTGQGDFLSLEAEARADGFATTTTLGKVIPTTILQEFIKVANEKHGQIYAKVRKLSVQGGLEIPIAQLAANAVWVAEGAGSDRVAGVSADTSVSFKYHVLELKIAQSIVANIVSLDAFEREVVQIMVDAFAKAMDTAIIAGTGVGQPLGITVDPRVTNVVEMTEADMADWTKWMANLFAKVPLAYSGGEFLFTKSTWMTYIMSMKDQNDRPLASALDSENGAFGGKFFGREATLVEPGALKDFATAGEGDVIGVYWVPNDYIVNTQQEVAFKRYIDEDTNQVVNKCLAVADGKIGDAAGCFIIKKKVSA